LPGCIVHCCTAALLNMLHMLHTRAVGRLCGLGWLVGWLDPMPHIAHSAHTRGSNHSSTRRLPHGRVGAGLEGERAAVSPRDPQESGRSPNLPTYPFFCGILCPRIFVCPRFVCARVFVYPRVIPVPTCLSCANVPFLRPRVFRVPTCHSCAHVSLVCSQCPGTFTATDAEESKPSCSGLVRVFLVCSLQVYRYQQT
jgi:hypothetical protein